MAPGMLMLDPRDGDLVIASRRTFLAASLAGIVAPTAARAAVPVTGRNDTACIVLFLDGGPSHHDMFDPKPEAPREVRGSFGVTDTSVPGIRIGDQLPRLAAQAHRFSLVRSLHHGNPSHAPAEHQMLTGWMGTRSGTARAVIENPSLGSVVARLRGPRVPGLPAYVAVPWSFHHAYGGSPFGAASYLGAHYEPFESGQPPNSATEPHEVPVLALKDGVTPDRLLGRQHLLARLDAGWLADSPIASRAREFTGEAMRMLQDRRVRDAFDLSREPARLREAYGRHEWGQGALVARRLVEAGVTFVMLQCGLRQDWDTHDNNFTRLRDKLLPPLDAAAATLLADLADRGLDRRTLVLVIGEFGRTPVINAKAGRDHWARVFSALVAGGGLNTGLVVGASDATGSDPAENPLHARDLFATMYHALGIDWQGSFPDGQGRRLPVLLDAAPIAELV